ncbi:MAG: hypothetical protein U0270_14300 [Labilithrix sp.]
MTMRLDIVTNDAGENVRREHARELGSGVVVAIYRLVKLAQMHDLGNQAFVRQLEQTHQMIGEYCLRSGSNVNVFFADKATFVSGQLLKGNRGAYEAAAELGRLLESMGGSDLHVAREITREDLRAFAEQVSMVHRTGNASQVRFPPTMQLRHVTDAARLRGIELEDLSADQRIVRAYASAVVIMRRFFEDLGASRYVLPRRIKRIAQSLVDLSDASKASYLGVTEVRNANFDEAGRAVNTAILAVAIARETTSNRGALSQIAMAAMMHDVARPRALALAGAMGGPMPGMAGPTTLSEDQEDRLAAGAAAVLTALGRVNEPSITRTVLAFESLWLRRKQWLGPVYWGARAPTMHATIIAVARRYNDLLTPEPGLPPPTTDYAVAMLANELTDAQDRTVLRMLVSALNLLPVGTIVQLQTGEIAEVTRGAKGLGDQPRVMLLADANNQQYAQPVELETAQDPRRKVHRVLAIDGWSKGLAGMPSASQGDDNPHGPDSDVDIDMNGDGSSNNVPELGAGPTVTPPKPQNTLQPQAAQPQRSEQYENQFKSWQGGGAPEEQGSGLELADESHPESQPLPSLGSSPSAVAEAMGRMINDSLAPPSVPPRTEVDRPDRTVVQQAGMPFPGAPSAAPAPQVATTIASREPTAKGNLAATPLPHVLVYMLDHGLTGSVVFEGTGGGRVADDTIYFVNGVPSKIRLGDTIALLGEVLVSDGSLQKAQVEQAVNGAKRLGILLGEFLVGHDLVSREALAWALEGQLLRKIAHVANLAPEIEYSFFRDVDLLSDWGGDIQMTHPLNSILSSVRHWTDRSRVRATLNRIGKHPLVLHADSDLGTLAAVPEEQKVLDAIRAESMPLHELFKRRLADDETVSSLVYTLAVTRQFSFKGQKKSPMAPRGGAWRTNAPTSSSPGSISNVPGVSGSRPAISAVKPAAAAASAAAGGTMPVPPTDTGKTPAAKIAPPSQQMRAAQPVARAPNPAAPASSVGPIPSGAPGRSAPQIRPVVKKADGTGPGVRPPPPSQRSMPAAAPQVPPSERNMPAASPATDDAKTMIATASPEQIKALMAGKRPTVPGAAPPPLAPPPPLRKANSGNLPPKPSPPSRSNQLAAPPAPPPSSERNMPAAAPTPSPSSGSKAAAPPPRATGANPKSATARAAPQTTMKGVAPAPPEHVPSIRTPEDAENAATGRIAISDESDERTERRDVVKVEEESLADAEAALEAMTHFQNAETALAKGDLKKAEDYAKKAAKFDPNDASYTALLAFVQAQNGTMPVDDAIRKISKVLIEDPSNEKGLFFRAKLLAKKNKLHEAINDFDELLNANPNHMEAQKEVQELRAKLPP